jgi:hypothetical protein
MKPIEQSLAYLYARVELFELHLAGLKNELRPLVFPEVPTGDVEVGWEIYQWGEWEPVTAIERYGYLHTLHTGPRATTYRADRTVVARPTPAPERATSEVDLLDEAGERVATLEVAQRTGDVR